MACRARAPISFALAAVGLFPAPAEAQQGPPPDSSVRDQIVVTGHRLPAGDDVKPADSLSAADVSTFGADRVADVIARLRDYYGGGGFSIIVNGRRLGGIDDILELPPEALAKIEILPEQAGGKYGLGTEQKVLNLVLRQHFRSVIGTASAGMATDGGAETASGDARYANLQGERRLNASFTVRHASPVLGQDRFPATSDPTLWDRSLVPETNAASLTAGFARPLGGASINLTMRAGTQSSSQIGGLAIDGGAAAPSIGVLQQDSRSNTLHTGATVGGTAGKLSWSLDGQAEFGSSTVSTVLRPSQMAALIDAIAATSLPQASAFPRRSSTSQRYAVSATIGGPFLRFPAGWATFNMTADASTDRSTQNAVSTDSPAIPQIRRNWGWRTSIGTPLVRRGNGLLGFLGDISANGSVGLAHSSGLRTSPSYDASLNWTVSRSLTFGAGTRQTTTAPGAEQLYSPLVRQSGVLIFDPVTNSTLAPTRITGGNPFLRRQREVASNIRANFNTRVGAARAVASMTYMTQRTNDPVVMVSGPGTALEEAFPERFVRDAQGVLQSIDMRSVNATRRERTSALWDLHLSGDLNGQRPSVALQQPHLSARFGGMHWELGLSYSWLLSETLLLRLGTSPLNLLTSPLNSSGQLPSRRTAQARAGLANARFTAQLSGNWREGTDGVLGQGSERLGLRYAALLTMDGQVTLNIGRSSDQGDEGAGMRIKLAVTNLLNARPHVEADGGALPFALDPRILDPVGRTLQLSLRKRF